MQTSTRRQAISALVLVVSGVLGLGVVLALATGVLSMMASGLSSGGPIVFGYGPALLFLSLHVAYSVGILAYGLAQWYRRLVALRMLYAMVAFSLLVLVISLIPGSTLGSMYFPVPLIALIGLAIGLDPQADMIPSRKA